MRTAIWSALAFMTLLASDTIAKPGEITAPLDRLKFLDLSGTPGDDFVGDAADGVFGALAGQDACFGSTGTTYYGGTVWDGADGRWEGYAGGTWTFDSGVNSEVIATTGADYPGVNPYKPAGLHAYMEGWIGFDNSYSEIPYFRLLDDGVGGTVWDNVCVGDAHAAAPAVLGGDYSFYCGVLPDEAETLCFTDQTNKEGYGNSWVACIGKTYYNWTGGSANLQYDYVAESEAGFDFTTVEIDTSGDGSADNAWVIAYDGFLFGHEDLNLSPGIELPTGPRDSIQVRFCFASDGAWSDEDGLNSTVCGAFSVDNIALAGGGQNDGPSTFEGGNANGWSKLPAEAGAGGEWSNLVTSVQDRI